MKSPAAQTIFAPIIGKQNLLISEGYEHERARKMINPAFYHTNLKSMTNQSVDLQLLFNTLTFSIIVSSAFASYLQTNANARHVMNVIDNETRLVTELVNKIIVDRKQEHSSSLSNGPGLLDLLLSTVDNEGKSFTDQEIKEHALTFVLAGSETTANIMTWMFYILMTHKDVFEACREEVDRVLPNDIEPTNENLADLV
ncbi:unnamed protein product, partial [Rotaria sordida]